MKIHSVILNSWQASPNDVQSSHQRATQTLPRRMRTIQPRWSAKEIEPLKQILTPRLPSLPPNGTNCQPPFINHRRNHQPFPTIPAYAWQLFQDAAFLTVSGDNDNDEACIKPCNRSWLQADRQCQALRLYAGMKSEGQICKRAARNVVVLHQRDDSRWRLLCFFL